MVKIRSKKFGAAEKLKHSAKRDRGAARGVNKQHHKLKLACSSTPQQKTVQLRDFQQEWFFSDIVGLTDKQAEMMLRRFGVLPKKGGVLHCWQCGERMSQASSSTGADSGDVKQCCNCKVPGRLAGFLHSMSLPTPLKPRSPPSMRRTALLAAAAFTGCLDSVLAGPGLHERLRPQVCRLPSLVLLLGRPHTTGCSSALRERHEDAGWTRHFALVGGGSPF